MPILTPDKVGKEHGYIKVSEKPLRRWAAPWITKIHENWNVDNLKMITPDPSIISSSSKQGIPFIKAIPVTKSHLSRPTLDGYWKIPDPNYIYLVAKPATGSMTTTYLGLPSKEKIRMFIPTNYTNPTHEMFSSTGDTIVGIYVNLFTSLNDLLLKGSWNENYGKSFDKAKYLAYHTKKSIVSKLQNPKALGERAQHGITYTAEPIGYKDGTFYKIYKYMDNIKNGDSPETALKMSSVGRVVGYYNFSINPSFMNWDMKSNPLNS